MRMDHRVVVIIQDVHMREGRVEERADDAKHPRNAVRMNQSSNLYRAKCLCRAADPWPFHAYGAGRMTPLAVKFQMRLP